MKKKQINTFSQYYEYVPKPIRSFNCQRFGHTTVVEESVDHEYEHCENCNEKGSKDSIGQSDQKERYLRLKWTGTAKNQI